MNKCYLPLIEDALERYLPGSDSREKKLIESMRYSLKAGGKRVRPMLVLEFNALCGGKINLKGDIYAEAHDQACAALCLRGGDGAHLFADPRRPALHG